MRAPGDGSKTKNMSPEGTSNNVSPVPTRKHIDTASELAMDGQSLTPAPGRLTPLGPGRMKAPPVTCLDLKKVASNINVFNTTGVCFSGKEANDCAEKALALNGTASGGSNMEEMPLNIHDPPAKSRAESAHTRLVEGKKKALPNKTPSMSSGATVVTAYSTSSCGQSVAGSDRGGNVGSDVAAVASVKIGPPLAVVRTDSTFTSEDEAAAAPGTRSLSATFTDKLAKESTSRQGRSLQRWLMTTDSSQELVRQVAGTVPITRDGQIVLISAARKKEWILPKGGWDSNESKEECAARETFEEGGLLGSLGGCLTPIDYETAKAKKRKLSKRDDLSAGGKSVAGERKGSGGEVLCKRARPETTLKIPESSSSATKEARPSESPSSSGASAADAAARISFDPKNYSYVRLFLFPLYVSSVKSHWPEKGRLRKLVDIDEAIQIMRDENRPYFEKGLEMIKERGLEKGLEMIKESGQTS